MNRKTDMTEEEYQELVRNIEEHSQYQMKPSLPKKWMGNVYISGESRPDKKLYQADDRQCKIVRFKYAFYGKILSDAPKDTSGCQSDDKKAEK